MLIRAENCDENWESRTSTVSCSCILLKKNQSFGAGCSLHCFGGTCWMLSVLRPLIYCGGGFCAAFRLGQGGRAPRTKEPNRRESRDEFLLGDRDWGCILYLANLTVKFSGLCKWNLKVKLLGILPRKDIAYIVYIYNMSHTLTTLTHGATKVQVSEHVWGMFLYFFQPCWAQKLQTMTVASMRIARWIAHMMTATLLFLKIGH